MQRRRRAAAWSTRSLSSPSGTYVVGPVKFGADHTSKLPIVELQWQGGMTVVVGPTK